MAGESVLPTWAPRVKPYLVHQLYESDALGLVDEPLIEEVGWALVWRCQSFLQANEANHGRVSCPTCETIICHNQGSKEVLTCPNCNWSCTWRDYAATIKNQQLNGGPEVLAQFKDFSDQFPHAQTPSEKMVLIDTLIHGFHHYLRSGRTRRPVGVNLLKGDLNFVIDFLNQLAYGSQSTPGTVENKTRWRENMNRTRQNHLKPNP